MTNSKRLLRGLGLALAAAATLSIGTGSVLNAQAKKQAASDPKQQTVTDVAGRTHIIMKKVTPAERQAAADRLKAQVRAAGDAAVLAADPGAITTLAPYPVTPGAMPLSNYLIGSNGQLVPDYSGLTANWAYSPTPTVNAPSTSGTVVVGNGTSANLDLASESLAVRAGQVAPFLTILAQPLGQTGTLTSFQSWNQAGGANPSAGNKFRAYILRPAALNTYTVLYDSGVLTVPALPLNGGSQMETYLVTGAPVTVEATDVLAFYGQGIPVSFIGSDNVFFSGTTAPTGTFVLDPGNYWFSGSYALGATLASAGVPTITGGIRKFIDTLPGLNTPNNLGQQIPVATAQGWPIGCSGAACTADYYELEVGEYTEQMHTDLAPTTLRGYRQTNGPLGLGQPFHYLGPLIIAQKGKPVRITLTNNLPTGAGGNLFLPVDASVMGSGPGPNSSAAGQPNDVCKAGPGQAVPAACYSQNRATIHLHGGVTPWISDGTTHQWITPAGDATQYPKGVSVYNVPDMPNPGEPPSSTAAVPGVGANASDPSKGVQTFYYTNDQSARLMFYHDHAAGITRLNVYAGVAAGYLLQDPTELELVAQGVIPADQIPLVIQDKTFVDPAEIGKQDPTWNWGTGPVVQTAVANGVVVPLRAPKLGDLWWPHVYQPAQNPYDLSGYNATGRWNYGPWFYPPTTGIAYGPVDNPYCAPTTAGGPCTVVGQSPKVPGTPNPSWGAEAFLDTPVINGTLYPKLTVAPKAYRFRILNAAHDRFWNLQLYRADTTVPPGCPTCASNTEVRMVPAVPNPSFPPMWPQDGRAGGAPDPTTAGPEFIQIGTEGGFLPRPVVVPNQPVLWNSDPLTFNFGNVSDHALLLGPAERADVIVDFSKFAGQTLILYNDAPAAFPAADPRNDYYTGNPDQFDTGGTGSTLPGFGPNTRTIMQIVVGTGTPAAFDLPKLMTAWAPGNTGLNFSPAGVFEHAQDAVIVGQGAQPPDFSGYDGVYSNNTTFRADPPFGLGTIYDSHVNFELVQKDAGGLDIYRTILAEPKAIHDEMGATFDDYGRMKASLGVAMPNPTPNTANFIMQGYADPATEIVKLSSIGTLIGDPLADGTQIWRLNHNGVDTHPIHFHLFHVQVVNRVGWDGAIRLPDATELGWKDTVRVSPLEDTYVALRPIAPLPATLPFKVPNSFRPHEPALPPTASWQVVDPLGNARTVVNDSANFGWEYVWHCHILSHEENDMMRPVVFTAPPEAPTGFGFTTPRTSNQVVLNWMDNSVSATSFTVERTANAVVTTVTVPVTQCAIQAGCPRTYTDATASQATAYSYRLRATNTVGSTVLGYPSMTVESAWTGPLSVPAAVVVPNAATNLTATASGPTQVALQWSYAQGSSQATSFLVQRALGNGAFATITTINTVVNGTNTYTDTTGLLPGTTYRYQVIANGAGGDSLPSNIATVLTRLVAPTNLRLTANLRAGGVGRIIMTWSDTNTTNATGFTVERSTNGGGTWTVATTTGITTFTYQMVNTVQGTSYQFRVRATNTTTGAVSANSNTLTVVAQ